MATGNNNTRPAPRERFGRDYAAGLAASLNPRIAYYTQQQQALRTPEDIEMDITRLYDPAIAAAGRVGEDVAKVGQTGLSALTGLASVLPGMDVGLVADAARGVGRAGGTAALTGAMLGTNVRGQLASSILQGRRMREDESRRLGEQVMGAQEEQARIAADWMPAAMQRQQMATTALQNKALMQDLKNAPVNRRRAILENRLLSGQITAQDLTNAETRVALKKLGLTDKQINDIAGRTPTPQSEEGVDVG